MPAQEYPQSNEGRVPLNIGGHALAVDPDDDTDLPYFARALYIETGGDIEIVTRSGETLVIAVPDNHYFGFVQVARVKATNTTASGIFATF